MTTIKNTATEKCEKILRNTRSDNINRSIKLSDNKVIDRLLSNRKSMACVYEELAQSLNEQQIDNIFELVIYCATQWSPEKTAAYRTDKKELEAINLKISSLSRQLANELEKRESLHNYSVFSTETHYSIVDVIEHASKDNGLYTSFLRKPLHNIRGQFSLKYWPSIAEVVAEIGIDTDNAEICATDSLTEVSTSSSRTSKVDFLRALFSALQDSTQSGYGEIPNKFSLSDRSISEIMNCSLQLEPEELVDASYVKRERQRQRQNIR